MALDDLPTDFVSPDRDPVRDQFQRDWVFRVPSAKTGPNTQVYVEASTFADQVMPVYANTERAAAAQSWLTATGSDLDDWLAALGLPPRRGVTSADGFVSTTIIAGGASITVGEELKHLASGAKFTVLVTNTYDSTTPIPIIASTGGPSSNLPAGTELRWTNPPLGVSDTALVIGQENGAGLQNGAPAESDDAVKLRIGAAVAEPPAAGNEEECVEVIEKIRDLAVEKCFVIPCDMGPGTKTVFFTLPPTTPGASRIPSSLQLAEAEAALKTAFPGEDGYMMANGADDLVRFVLKVTWRGETWVDAAPWPPLLADVVHVNNPGGSPPTPEAFRVTSSSTLPAPAVGLTIAVLDRALGRFRKKRIATVTVVSANHTYDLTFDTVTLNASDLSFAPVNGAAVSPWSPSLDAIIRPLLDYIDKQGPGETHASFPDPGRRQRRYPAPSPDAWPSSVENRAVDGLFPVVEDAIIVEPTIPLATAVGTPGALVYLHRLSDIAAYPE